MQARKFLIVAALVTGGTTASAADVLFGQVPIGLTGTFTVELTGCATTTTSSNAKYVKNTVTGVVTLSLPSLNCVAVAGTTNVINLPSEILPANHAQIPVIIAQNFVFVPGMASATANVASLTLAYWNGTQMSGPFPVGQSKGLALTTITYQGYPDT